MRSEVQIFPDPPVFKKLVSQQMLNMLIFYGAIAQLGERLLCKQEVGGSIPPGSTRESFRNKTNNELFLNHSVVECDL